MNKKGDTQKILLFIFYLIIAFLIIYTSTSYLSNYFNGAEFNKEFIAKDLGLAIDTISFSPNEIQMKYNLSRVFIAESKNSILKIKLKDLEFPREYIFISDIEDFSKKSDELIVKKEDKLKIS